MLQYKQNGVYLQAGIDRANLGLRHQQLLYRFINNVEYREQVIAIGLFWWIVISLTIGIIH